MTSPSFPRPVVWTAEAERELEAIRTYIGAFNPLAAQRMSLRLIAAADSLGDLSARHSVAGPAREMVAVRPYVIRYRVAADCVIILRVRHGARRPMR
jgi:plasmid stabilization system protein ParE